MTQVSVHPLTHDPTDAWNAIRPTQPVYSVKARRLRREDPTSVGSVRFVCISNTHGKTAQLPFAIPDGDVLIHTGNITAYGSLEEVKEFNSFLATLPHKYKIVIGGNHDSCFDRTKQEYSMADSPPERLLTEAMYLEDSYVTICGIKVYGAPWVPNYRNLAFNVPRGRGLLRKWNLIPNDADILITHAAPLGHGDMTTLGERLGCVELLHTVRQRVKPCFHIYGQVKEGYGITTDGHTVFINASTCNNNLVPCNRPILFDFAVPGGFSKTKGFEESRVIPVRSRSTSQIRSIRSRSLPPAFPRRVSTPPPWTKPDSIHSRLQQKLGATRRSRPSGAAAAEEASIALTSPRQKETKVDAVTIVSDPTFKRQRNRHLPMTKSRSQDFAKRYVTIQQEASGGVSWISSSVISTSRQTLSTERNIRLSRPKRLLRLHPEGLLIARQKTEDPDVTPTTTPVNVDVPPVAHARRPPIPCMRSRPQPEQPQRNKAAAVASSWEEIKYDKEGVRRWVERTTKPHTSRHQSRHSNAKVLCKKSDPAEMALDRSTRKRNWNG